jgi:hypothetical protein
MELFFGVVEANVDPEKLGRCKVRIVGDHIQDKSEIPSDDLPWAVPMMPSNSSSMDGIGDSPTGIMLGSWVVVCYIDGKDKQQPIILGTIPGMQTNPPNAGIGFNDPKGMFPNKVGEPSTNVAARGTTGKHAGNHPSIQPRKINVLHGILTAADQWSEPSTPAEPVYPYNKVWEGPHNTAADACEWGHLEEWDSTPGAERYFRQHKTSQNFLEIHPDGKEVRKIHGDNFEFDLNSKHLLIKGDYRVTIEGNKDEYIMGDYWQTIEGNFHRVIKKNDILHCKQNIISTSEGKTIRRSEKQIYDLSYGNIFRKSNENITDVANQNYLNTSGMETTLGLIAEPVPLEWDPIIPEIKVMETMTDIIALSCTGSNKAKFIKIKETFPEFPEIVMDETVVTVDKIRIQLDMISIDTQDINLLGVIHAPYVICPITNYQILTVLDPIPLLPSIFMIKEEPLIPDLYEKTEPKTIYTAPGEIY